MEGDEKMSGTQQPGDKVIYEGHLKLVHRPHKGTNYDVVVSKDAAIMLYIDSEDQVYFAKQFRPAINQMELSLPAETLDKPELSPLEVMVEGLEEECGVRIDESQVEYLGKVASSAGHDSEFVYLYIARGEGEKVGQRLEETEEIDVVRVSFDEAYQMVLKNEIKGSKTSHLILYEKLRRLGEIKK
jgi:ADP-ribose pyrophosphatase